jgi:hypothetical protein
MVHSAHGRRVIAESALRYNANVAIIMKRAISDMVTRSPSRTVMTGVWKESVLHATLHVTRYVESDGDKVDKSEDRVMRVVVGKRNAPAPVDFEADSPRSVPDVNTAEYARAEVTTAAAAKVHFAIFSFLLVV